MTERHLMYALAKKMTQKAGKGQPMIDYLASIGLSLSEKQKNQMLDTAYPFYEYDLLGILKSAFVPKDLHRRDGGMPERARCGQAVQGY